MSDTSGVSIHSGGRGKGMTTPAWMNNNEKYVYSWKVNSIIFLCPTLTLRKQKYDSINKKSWEHTKEMLEDIAPKGIGRQAQIDKRKEIGFKIMYI